jgi:hypothetical protein
VQGPAPEPEQVLELRQGAVQVQVQGLGEAQVQGLGEAQVQGEV